MADLLKRSRGRLYFGEGDQAYSMPNPADADLEEAMRRMRYQPELLTDQDRWRILAAAEAYQHLFCYPIREYTAQQFADIRRATRDG